MQASFVEEYFTGEQSESIFFIIIGLVMIAIGTGVYIYYRTRFTLGILIPLIMVGIIQVIVGTSIFFRSPDDISRVEGFYENELVEEINSKEIPRMEEVLQNFQYYMWAEIGLIIISFVMLIIGIKKRFILGFGIALLLQSSIMLIFDHYAENRGEEYLRYLIDSTIDETQ